LIGIAVSLVLRKYFKASQDDRKTKVTIFAIALVATVVITPIITMETLSGVLDSDKRVENVPKGYSVLKLEDFPGYEQANIEIQRFDKNRSPIVPKHFEYWEFDENKLSMASEYYRAINPYFAKKIFDGKLEKETRHREAVPGSKTEWGADDVYYIGDSNTLIILKNNVVVFVEGDFDLSNAQIKNIVINKLL